MPLKIIRNDIVKMNTDAIVNAANQYPEVGDGCDRAIYYAAGYEKMLEARKKIGELEPGFSAITPGFDLPAKYVIHTVSPLYIDGTYNEEQILRECYKNSLEIAKVYNISSIAFPLIATGSFGYPKEEAILIAIEEINRFLLQEDMLIYIVVFGTEATLLGKKLFPDLKVYIDQNYVRKKREEEYGDWEPELAAKEYCEEKEDINVSLQSYIEQRECGFSDYLKSIIDAKGYTDPQVYKRAIVDKKAFNKIINNPTAHPSKETALKLCIGLKLSIEESNNFLARAGYAFSSANKTDIVFKYFINQKHYDMVDIDIAIEECGEPCFIS